MREKYILKLCLYSERINASDITQFLCMPNNLERIYSNIYRQEYRSSIRYEDVTFMKTYTEKDALKLFTKRIELSQTPFFLDFYQMGQDGESISIARTGKYIFLYMQISSESYERHKKNMRKYCEDLAEENKLFLGHCSRLMLQQGGEISWRRLIYARHNKPDYDLKEETSFLECENILSIEQQYTDEENIIIWKNK